MNSERLENHIDDPIKKCVVGLALLGFEPVFSCCGFTYKDEYVTKSHMLNKPYIFLDYQKISTSSKSMLVDIAVKADWTISFVGSYYIDFYCRDALGAKNDGHPWYLKGTPHQHELNVFGINRLEKAIDEHKRFFGGYVVIEDGNLRYRDRFGLKYWQQEATEPWVVTPEIYSKL